MMKTFHFIYRCVPLAACALTAPLQAAPSPQEIFARLSAPTEQIPMTPEKRAAALPALALIAPGADMIVAAASAGPASLELMRLLGEQPTAELERGVGSIKSAALMVSEGGVGAMETLLPVLLQNSQTEALQACRDQWLEKAKPEFADSIRRAFDKQMTLHKEQMLSAYNAFRMPPIYYAITAEPGREADFQAMHREIVQNLRNAPAHDSELKYDESEGFASLHLSQLAAYKWLMKKEPADPQLRQAMAQRKVYLITCMQGSAALFVLCERPEDIVLPPDAEHSMLYSSKLSGADAHMNNLVATAWVSTGFNKAMHSCLQSSRYPMAQAVVDALKNIGAQPTPQPQVYNDAAQSLTWLAGQPSYFEEIRTPFTMQVWQSGKELYMQTISDGQGMEFAPGQLKLVDQAVAPNSIFYMESTAFSAPNTPNASDYREKLVSALLSVGKGISLTLKDEAQKELHSYISFAELFMPEIESLGNAVQTLAGGLGAPFALLATRIEPNKDDSKVHTGLAFCADVRNRPGLSEGWQQMLNAVAHAAGKLGVPPMLVAAMPISSQALGGTAAAYAIDLPGTFAKSLPKVAVSDTRFVLGNNAQLNATLISASGAPMPFSGAVSAIDMPRLSAAVEQARTPDSCAEQKQKLTNFLRRLSERVQTLYSTSVIRDGVRTARGLMMLK